MLEISVSSTVHWQNEIITQTGEKQCCKLICYY